MALPYPLPPRNVIVYPGQNPGSFSLQWDSPTHRLENTNRVIVGCNVYRSIGSPDIGFSKLNDTPIQVLTYLDDVQVVYHDHEPPAKVVVRDHCDYEPTFIVSSPPIFSGPTSSLVGERTWEGVEVWVNGEKQKILRVVHATGEVVVDNRQYYDPVTRTTHQPVDFSTSPTIEISYYSVQTLLPVIDRAPIYYKVTSVDDQGNETPLDVCEAFTHLNVDRLTWYWKEAIWRNSWLLYEGGERVKHYARKVMGPPCTHNVDPRVADALKSHPHNCPVCFGTGIVGGYTGPHDILIAPPQEEHSFERTVRGLVDNFNQATWTGPSPIITQRDLIIKQTGERFLVGPVAVITCPGAILQQEFTIQPIDVGDYLYKFPIEGTDGAPGIPWPTVTDKPAAGPDQDRGRTEVFVETTYGAEGAVPKELLRRKE